MGVTIHFEGFLRNDASVTDLIRGATVFAQQRHWATEEIHSSQVRLTRVIDEQDVDYEGPVHGVVLYPHEDCDPVRLEVGSDLFVQEFVKTQFAGVGTHQEVIALLRAVEPLFERLTVEDEGELWETSDRELVEKHIDNTNRVIAEYLAEHPGSRSKVKIQGGRIVDIMS